jgi:hypothetical protein
MAGNDSREGASLPSLRLDADRAREELEDTLDEIERLVHPKELLAAATKVVRGHLAVSAGVATALIALAGIAIAIRVRRTGRG